MEIFFLGRAGTATTIAPTDTIRKREKTEIWYPDQYFQKKNSNFANFLSIKLNLLDRHNIKKLDLGNFLSHEKKL